MSFMIAAAATVAVSTAYMGYEAHKGAKRQAGAIRDAAALQAKTDQEIAEKQRKQAEEAQRKQQEAERVRAAALAAQEAEQRRQAADAAIANLSDDNEPTVQLAVAADPTTKSKRRAQFRPDYASGVTI